MALKSDENLAIACIQCGYDLRATPLHAHCPECGTPVLHSKPGYRVDGDMLVVRSKVKLPRQYCRAKLPAILEVYGPTIVPPPAFYMPVPRPMKFRHVPVWLQIVCLFGPVVLAALVFVAAMFAQAAGMNVASGQIIGVTLVGGLVIGEVVQRAVGKRCQITIYSSPAGFVRHFVAVLLGTATVVAIVAASILTLVLLNRLGLGRLGALSTIVIVLVGSVGLVVMSRLTSVRVARYADGEFWIKGFGRGYLQTCEAVRARVHEEAMRANGSHASVHLPDPLE